MQIEKMLIPSKQTPAPPPQPPPQHLHTEWHQVCPPQRRNEKHHLNIHVLLWIERARKLISRCASLSAVLPFFPGDGPFKDGCLNLLLIVLPN